MKHSRNLCRNRLFAWVNLFDFRVKSIPFLVLTKPCGFFPAALIHPARPGLAEALCLCCFDTLTFDSHFERELCPTIRRSMSKFTWLGNIHKNPANTTDDYSAWLCIHTSSIYDTMYLYVYIHSICSRLYCIYILCINIKWYITLAPSNDSFYPRQPLVWSIAYLREQSKSEQVSLAKLKQVASFPSKELLCDAGTCGEEGLCKFARCHAEAVAYDHR